MLLFILVDVPGTKNWQLSSLSISPVCQSEQTVLKSNARAPRTGSGQNGPAHGSEPLSQFSRSGRPKRRNLESCGGKNVCARLGPSI